MIYIVEVSIVLYIVRKKDNRVSYEPTVVLSQSVFDKQNSKDWPRFRDVQFLRQLRFLRFRDTQF